MLSPRIGGYTRNWLWHGNSLFFSSQYKDTRDERKQRAKRGILRLRLEAEQVHGPFKHHASKIALARDAPDDCLDGAG